MIILSQLSTVGVKLKAPLNSLKRKEMAVPNQK
jgi:hypothetical protein